MNYFTVRPTKWHHWINPFWWRRRKTIQAVLNYQWEKVGKEKFKKAYMDHILYGTSINFDE